MNNSSGPIPRFWNFHRILKPLEFTQRTGPYKNRFWSLLISHTKANWIMYRMKDHELLITLMPNLVYFE